MQQLSRSYQIALGAMLVLVVVWFVALKPSNNSDSSAATVPVPASAPGQQGLTGAVAKANGAAQTSTAANAAQQAADAAASGTTGASGSTTGSGATGATGTTGAKGAAGATKAPTGDGSGPIMRDLRAGKVAVLLFYAATGSDDAAVRRALLTVDRHAGRVSIRSVPITRVGRYRAITEGVEVTEAPTLLAIGPDHKARALVGVVDTRSIDQLVGDVGGLAFQPHTAKGYTARIKGLCAVVGPTLRASALDGADLQERLAVLRSSLADAVAATKTKGGVPKRYRAFQTAFITNLRETIAAYNAVGTATAAHRDATAAYAPHKAALTASIAGVQRAARAAHLSPGC